MFRTRQQVRPHFPVFVRRLVPKVFKTWAWKDNQWKNVIPRSARLWSVFTLRNICKLILDPGTGLVKQFRIYKWMLTSHMHMWRRKNGGGVDRSLPLLPRCVSSESSCSVSMALVTWRRFPWWWLRVPGSPHTVSIQSPFSECVDKAWETTACFNLYIRVSNER